MISLFEGGGGSGLETLPLSSTSGVPPGKLESQLEDLKRVPFAAMGNYPPCTPRAHTPWRLASRAIDRARSILLPIAVSPAAACGDQLWQRRGRSPQMGIFLCDLNVFPGVNPGSSVF